MINAKLNHEHQIQDSYMRLFQFLFIASIISITPLLCFGQTNNGELEAQVKAAYIYNFTKFLDWKQNNSENFYISVLGRDNITAQLNNIADKEKVNGKKIIVNEITDLKDLSFCNVLYISTQDESYLYNILKKIKGKNVLLIANSNGFAEKGVGINLLEIENKIKFEINRKAIEEAGIIPDTRLLSLALKIY